MTKNLTNTNAAESANGAPSVSFLEYACYREVKSLSEYTEDEMVAIWYTEEEYDAFKDSCKKAVKMIMKGTSLPANDGNFCYRGLENKTKEGKTSRRRNKDAVRFAVFDEQQAQQEEGYIDEDAVAQASIHASLESRKAALQIGLEDQLQSREMNKLLAQRTFCTRPALNFMNSTMSPAIRCNKGDTHKKRSLRALGLTFSNI